MSKYGKIMMWIGVGTTFCLMFLIIGYTLVGMNGCQKKVEVEPLVTEPSKTLVLPDKSLPDRVVPRKFVVKDPDKPMPLVSVNLNKNVLELDLSGSKVSGADLYIRKNQAQLRALELEGKGIISVLKFDDRQLDDSEIVVLLDTVKKGKEVKSFKLVLEKKK